MVAMADVVQEAEEIPPEDATIEQPAVEAPVAEKQPKVKEKKPKKPKEGKAVELPEGPSVAGHPRAVRSIERAKGWAALLGFAAGFYLSLPTHTPAAAGLRAIIAGVALYIGVWAGSVFFWRRMVMVEIRAREQQLVALARAAQARAAAHEPQGPGG